MSIQQPTSTDKLSSPDHSLSHRVFANDHAAPAESVVVDSEGKVGVGTVNPTSKLHVPGSLTMAYVAKTASYPLTISDYTVECTANSFTVTLPTASGIAGRIYNIKNTGTGIITVIGTGVEMIDGELTQTLNQWDSLQIQSNGSNWIII